MEKRAVITGIGGQDGSYLATFLLSQGYRVYGIVRPGTQVPQPRLKPIADSIEFHACELQDVGGLANVIRDTQAGEVYNLAAPSFVQTSWKEPVSTAEVIGLGTVCLLDAIRQVEPNIRFFQASSCEVFGAPQHSPQTELTPTLPISPYGAAKLYAQNLTQIYRNAYELHASVGIAYNHESPRRDPAYVSRKITRAVAAIKLGQQDKVSLGNLDARRDWGYAPDFVRAYWMMLQAEAPSDYIIATGESHTVREFCEEAFSYAGLFWKDHVEVDSRFVRVADTTTLVGDISHAKAALDWKPEVGFTELVRLMVDADIAALQNSTGQPT